jgi:hypothetical protein
VHPGSNGHRLRTRARARQGPSYQPPREHRIDSIRVSSVARVALLFYVGVLAMMIFGIGIAWFLASQFGVISGLEGFMRSVGFENFRVLSESVLLGATMIAVAVVAMCVVVTIAAAALYNAASAPWGGVHVTLSPRTDDAAGRVLEKVRVDGSEPGHRDGNGTSRPRPDVS